MRKISVHGGSLGCGLGNKLTAICGGYAAAKVSGSEFTVVWEKGKGCMAEWHDIFKPPALFAIVSTPPVGSIRHKEASYVRSRRKAHFRSIGANGFTPDYWAAWRECAQSIELRDDLELPETKGFIAVSIRANYPPRAPSKSWHLGRKLPDGCFICSDSPYHFSKAREICQDAWFLSEPSSSADLANRGVAGVRAAARDMMMMCRADSILAIGRRSTMRNMASIGYGVPVFKLAEGVNP